MEARNMRPSFWLKMLSLWLEPRVVVEQDADLRRSQHQQELNALEIRKAEAAAWYYPTLY